MQPADFGSNNRQVFVRTHRGGLSGREKNRESFQEQLREPDVYGEQSNLLVNIFVLESSAIDAGLRLGTKIFLVPNQR